MELPFCGLGGFRRCPDSRWDSADVGNEGFREDGGFGGFFLCVCSVVRGGGRFQLGVFGGFWPN